MKVIRDNSLCKAVGVQNDSLHVNLYGYSERDYENGQVIVNEYGDPPIPSVRTWTQPTLNANGVIGGDSVAVAASSEYSTTSGGQTIVYSAYRPFGRASFEWAPAEGDTDCWYEFYSPNPLSVSSIKFELSLSRFGSYSGTFQIEVWVGDDESNLVKFPSTNVTIGSGRNLSEITLLNNSNFYKIYRIKFLWEEGYNVRLSLNEILVEAMEEYNSLEYGNSYAEVPNIAEIFQSTSNFNVRLSVSEMIIDGEYDVWPNVPQKVVLLGNPYSSPEYGGFCITLELQYLESTPKFDIDLEILAPYYDESNSMWRWMNVFSHITNLSPTAELQHDKVYKINPFTLDLSYNNGTWTVTNGVRTYTSTAVSFTPFVVGESKGVILKPELQEIEWPNRDMSLYFQSGKLDLKNSYIRTYNTVKWGKYSNFNYQIFNSDKVERVNKTYRIIEKVNKGEGMFVLNYPQEIQVVLIGGGGGKAKSHQTNNPATSLEGAGGSGACFIGTLNLNAGVYNYVVGSGGKEVEVESPEYNKVEAYAGTKTAIYNENVQIVSFGGAGGSVYPNSSTRPFAEGGKGGKFSVDWTPEDTVLGQVEVKRDGQDGFASINGTAAPGASWYKGYGMGNSGSGYLKIVYSIEN